jgi:hypothetical protein
MSLAALNTKETADQGIDVEILHPKTNIPIGIVVTVLGTDSEAFRAITRKQQNRRTENMRNRRGSSTLTAEELEAENLNTLTACTKAWCTVEQDDNGVETNRRDEIEVTDGEWLKCTPENVKRVYADAGFAWLREQIDREIGDRTNFLKG